MNLTAWKHWLAGLALVLTLDAALALWAVGWLRELEQKPVPGAWATVTGTGPAGREARRLWLEVQALLGALWALLFVDPGRRPAAPRPAAGYGSHGSARWAAWEEIRLHLRPRGPGLLVGKDTTGRLLYHPLDSALNQFAMVIGGSGSRKTRGYVVPNVLAETEASIICTDPKGEVYRLTAATKRVQGYQVRVLNLLHPAASDRYNPLACVRDTREAQRLAANLVRNTRGERPAAGDPFWEQAEQALITALVLYVVLELPPEQRHLASVLHLGTGLARDQEAMDRVFDALPADHPAAQAYGVFRLAEGKTRSSILIGFASRLQLWAGADIAALTAASDLDLAQPGRERVALYLILPDSESTFAPITALFWTQAMQELYREADRHGGRLPVRVRLLLDEFANIGVINDYPQLLSTCRGRGIQPEHIIQDPGQLQALYGEHAARTILASCDTLLFLGTNELEAASYVSRRLGQTTIRVDATSTSDRPGAGRSESHSYHGRPLLTPDEVLKLPLDESLLLQRARHPARLRKPDYTEAWPEIPTLRHQDYPAPERAPLHVVDWRRLVPPPPEEKAPELPAGARRLRPAPAPEIQEQAAVTAEEVD